MVQFNTRANEILLKLVYYGPGLSGKTTNLRSLHAMCKESERGEMFSVNTQEDRTLFFDLLPIDLGYIYGNSIHLQVYTVPGQVQYDASRRVVLGGADGVVFVADSSENQMQENVDSLSNLYHNLNANRLNIKQIPFVIQYNKRDLPDAMPVGVMNRRLNFRSVPYFESVANRGEGVLETFLAITRETVGTTFRKYHLDKKVEDFEKMLDLVESNVRSSMREFPGLAEIDSGAAGADAAGSKDSDETVLRQENASVADLVPGRMADPQDLLEDALKSNMETARLYSELKQAKQALETRNEEMRKLYAQLERASQDNLKTRRYLEGLIQSVGEAIVSFGSDGRILTWNAAAEQIFGYTRAEVVGRTFHQLTPPSRAGELDQAIVQVGKGQTVRDIPTTRLRKDGTEFPASITYAPIRGTDDRVLAYSALVRDLGSQQKLERKLADMENLNSLARILPPMFNEVANRLTPILLQRGMLMEELPEPALTGRIGKLLNSVEQVQTLLRPLLMMFNPSALRREPCNLNALVQDAVKRVEAEAAAAGVAIETNLDPNLLTCGLDPGMLREGIVCLLRSGLHESAASVVKRLRIATRQAGQVLQLVCQNTGRAIPEADGARVFELAYAKDVDSLGMSVIASVAKAHRGRISVRSQEGLGNAFLVEFPMVDAQVPSAPLPLQGRRVMVVDDEAFLLECLVDAISSWGCEVTPCSQATLAIEQLQTASFDLVVSDIRMPGLTGIQLFDWIRTNQPQMAKRVIFTTGDSFDPETRAFLEGAHAPHLGKPFDLRKLKQALTDLLASVEG